MEDCSKPLIDRLLRGVATDHVETVRDAWRGLLEAGPEAVGQVRQKLASSAWSENPRGPLSQYLGVLLSLLDTLDPVAFRAEIERLQATDLHVMHRRTVELLSQRLDEKPAVKIGPDIPVFIARDINEPRKVVANLMNWSQTRHLDLTGITRIDVIPRRADLDYLGRYNLFFSAIILTWPARPARGLRLWYQRLDAEFTFYHKVGHHVSGHLEGGIVAGQEKEANAYAQMMMHRSRPVLLFTGRVMAWLLKPILPRLKGLAQANEPRI